MKPLTLTYYTGDGVHLSPTEQSLYGTNDIVRQATRAGIRRFVDQHRDRLRGRVLDYGCGKLGTCAIPQPYRSLIDAAEYVGWEPGDSMPVGQFAAVLCTQVIQNVQHPEYIFQDFFRLLSPGGCLVLTYPVAWQEIESELWRFTMHGVASLCNRAGFRVLKQECLARVVLDGALELNLVNGLVAVRP